MSNKNWIKVAAFAGLMLCSFNGSARAEDDSPEAIAKKRLAILSDPKMGETLKKEKLLALEPEYRKLVEANKSKLITELSKDKVYAGSYLSVAPRKEFMAQHWDYVSRYHAALAMAREGKLPSGIRPSDLQNMNFSAKDDDLYLQVAGANPRIPSAIELAYQKYFREWVRQQPEFKEFLKKKESILRADKLKEELNREYLDIHAIMRATDIKDGRYQATQEKQLSREMIYKLTNRVFRDDVKAQQAKLGFKEEYQGGANPASIERAIIEAAFDSEDAPDTFKEVAEDRARCQGRTSPVPNGVKDASLVVELYGSKSIKQGPNGTYERYDGQRDSLDVILKEMTAQYRRGYGCGMPPVVERSYPNTKHYALGEDANAGVTDNDGKKVSTYVDDKGNTVKIPPRKKGITFTDENGQVFEVVGGKMIPAGNARVN